MLSGSDHESGEKSNNNSPRADCGDCNGNIGSHHPRPPTETIVIPRLPVGDGGSPGTAATAAASSLFRPSELNDQNRAVHIIKLSSLQHNYTCVESAAAQQRCSVIVVVKADGYGHGAIASALYLADKCGADAFAVATLEEAIVLRQAFQQNPPGKWTKPIASMFRQSSNNPKAAGRGGNPNANVMAAGVFSSSVSSDGTTLTPPGGGGGGGTGATGPCSSSQQPVAAARSRRLPRIRILVLGPPVGFPRCFSDYYHYDIELMISGPEVAASLAAWVANEKERKRTQVERAAAEAKEQALLLRLKQPSTLLNGHHHQNHNHRKNSGTTSESNPTIAAQIEANNNNSGSDDDEDDDGSSTGRPPAVEAAPLSDVQKALAAMEISNARKPLPHPSSTLGNVSGQDLAREVRTILMNQQAASEAAEQEEELRGSQAALAAAPPSQLTSTAASRATSTDTSLASYSAESPVAPPQTPASSSLTPCMSGDSLAAAALACAPTVKTVFAGIEAAAKNSRTREVAQAKISSVMQEDNASESSSTTAPTEAVTTSTSSSTMMKPLGNSVPSLMTPAVARKRLRWHALVDSGMGRLGFKPEPVQNDLKSVRRDTVEILRELVDLEIHGNAPIEFFGMCTHMADASSTSTYTHSQIGKFVSLLKRVRVAGISIPTVSTDNSAALLTTNLTHFDPNVILSQPNAHTRGYVRTGGAIYGQRPAFTQLRAMSTLVASVRHVAILHEGDSVGYDRAYVAKHDVRIATLTIGFADGYPRELGNGIGKVAIRGAVFPVAGNVCMDMTMVELGKAEDTDGVGATVVVGDTAVLWGPIEDDQDAGLVRLQDLATTLKTTQSALTCGLDKIRVSRLYV